MVHNEFDEREHIIMQLRKNVIMGGMKTVKFADGSTSNLVPVMYSERVLAQYASLSPNDKEDFQLIIDQSLEQMLIGSDILEKSGKLPRYEECKVAIGDDQPLPRTIMKNQRNW